MPLAIRDFSVLSYAHGFTYWHYKAGKDTVADVLAPGYFNDTGNMAARGDMILVSACNGGAMLYVDATADGVVVRQMCATKDAP